MPVSFQINHDTPIMVGHLRGVPDEYIAHVRGGWEAASEAFFSRTQESVHVITGRLKSTGRRHVEMHGRDVLEAVVEYGGIAADGFLVTYALAEEARGGTHAFMTRGAEATRRMFEEAFE